MRLTSSRGLRALFSSVLALVTLGVGIAVSDQSADAASLPPIKHVWIIMLENEDYASTFGNPTADLYLASTLPAKGAVLKQYYGIGHESNDNYIGIVSGQPPNPFTQSDCPVYTGFAAGSIDKGIETGVGCVYPSAVHTIASQLSNHKRSWKAYEQDMGNDASREAAACGHPALNQPDGTQEAESGDGYATRHDPFMYFEGVTGKQDYCNRHVVALGSTSGAMPKAALPGETGLATDLKSVQTTPAYSFITPNLCADGHDDPCKNETGQGSSLANIDAFLKTWVPRIKNSPAYRQGGLIEITFDESDGPQSDSSSCCGETAGPSSALPGITGPGGGRIGAVLLSPFIKPGTVSKTPYNHYSTLASVEKIFGLPLLGEARSVTATFGHDIFNKTP
jgi:phosphatidylinositol-3-phosphatase